MKALVIDRMVQDWPSPKKETENDQMLVRIGQS